MKNKIAVLVCILLLFSFFKVSFAAKFSDIDENQYSWAINEITEMTEKGIINGYPDGTFGPANNIRKIEALLLISRILGINEITYKENLDNIYNFYKDQLDSLNLQYEKELAFLIYKGVFTVNEIINLANSDKFNDSLDRSEVAVYLTKALGKYDILKTENNVDTGYSDNSKISASQRSSVKYLKDEKIMLGMDSQSNTFVPDFKVNRAQMAVLLYRVMNKNNLLILNGKFIKADVDKKQISVDLGNNTGSYDISEADFKINGRSVNLSEFEKNTEIILVFSDAVLESVEAFIEKPEIVSTVSGEVKEIILTANKTIKLVDSLDGVTKRYNVDDKCEVYVDDNKSTLSLLRLKDHARLYLNSDDIVIKIEVLDTTEEFKDGVIEKISVDDGLRIFIKKDNGEIAAYNAVDDVIVKRNSSDAMLKDVLPGDKIVKYVTSYSRIVRLEVKSDIMNTSGRIDEILISATSSIVLDKDGTKNRYPINNSIKITVDGKSADIYDLRLGMAANVTTDSGTITKIDVTSVEEVGQISGKVELVNTAYGFINVLLSNGETKQVFVSNSTKITADGATTATKTIKNINVSDYVVIIGKTVNGAFQATTIVIVDQ